ncbi:MAG: VOC family protein [Pseudonocardia sp.]|nr:VOC family protein [Pseudonocardia sp.]
MTVRRTPWPAGMPCWIDLGTPDLAAATSFYGSVFGWTFVDMGEQYGHYSIAQVDGRAAAAIGPSQPGQPAAWTVYLASDDADATAKLVADNGGTIVVDPMEIPGNGRMAVAFDASGAGFGIWQQTGMIGTEVYNEPGSLIWEDARLTDAAAAKRFYATVFGWTYEPVPGAPDDYSTFAVDGETAGGIGGMMGSPDGTPSHWLPYFMVADVDAAFAAVTAGGGTVVAPPMDTPFGRMGVVTDPFGATLSLHGGMPDA